MQTLSFFPAAIVFTALTSTIHLPSLSSSSVKLCHGAFSSSFGFEASLLDTWCFEQMGGVVLLLRENDFGNHDLIAMLGSERTMRETIDDLSYSMRIIENAAPAPSITWPDDERFVLQYDNWMPLLKELSLTERRVRIVGVEMLLPMDVPNTIALASRSSPGFYYDISTDSPRTLMPLERLVRRLWRVANKVAAIRLTAAFQLQSQTLTVQPLGPIPITGRKRKRAKDDEGEGPVKPAQPDQRTDEVAEFVAESVFVTYWDDDSVPIFDVAAPEDSVETAVTGGDVPRLLPSTHWDDVQAQPIVELDDDGDDSVGVRNANVDIEMGEEQEEDEEDLVLDQRFWLPEASGVVDGAADIIPSEIITVACEPIVHMDMFDQDMVVEEDEFEEDVVDIFEDGAEEEEEEEDNVPARVDVFYWDDRLAPLDGAFVDNSLEVGALAASAVPPTDVLFRYFELQGETTLVDPEVDNDASVSIMGAIQSQFSSHWDVEQTAVIGVVPDGVDDDLIAFAIAGDDLDLSIGPVEESSDAAGDEVEWVWDFSAIGGESSRRTEWKWQPEDRWKARSMIMKGSARKNFENMVRRRKNAFKRRDPKKIAAWLRNQNPAIFVG
jgi:hypothetical protein